METKAKSLSWIKRRRDRLVKLRKTIRSRVERGVKFLDKEFGRKSWVYKIDLKSLNLDNTETCILGQSFPGHFEEGARRLDEVKNSDYVNTGRYGFDIVASVPDSMEQSYWDILGDTWAGKIQKYRFVLERPHVKKALAVVSKAEKII